MPLLRRPAPTRRFRRPLAGLAAHLRATARLMLLPAVLGLAACDPSALGVTRGAPGAVQMALLLPSGASDAQVAQIAASLARAAELAVADTGDDRVTLRTYATGGSPAQAAAVARQAVSEGADVILGPFYAQTSNEAARAVAGTGTSVLSFSNNTEVAGGNLFLLGYTFQNTANQLGSYAARNGVRQLLVVNGRTPSEEIIRDAMVQGMAGSGARIVGTADFEFSQEGVQAAVPQIAALAENTGAQGIVLTSSTEGALPAITGLLPDVGLAPDAIQYIGVTRWNVPPSAVSLPGLQGGWFALPDPGRLSQFVSRYSAAYGTNPHSLAVLAYDAVNAVAVQAGKAGPEGVTPTALLQAGTFAGASGAFRFQTDRTVRRGLAIATIRNSQVTIVQAAPTRLGGLGS